jgi:hypothetical protein
MSCAILGKELLLCALAPLTMFSPSGFLELHFVLVITLITMPFMGVDGIAKL